jgi:thioredoxin-related protein/YHS domain-containing protein
MSARAKNLRLVLFAMICLGFMPASFAVEEIPWSTDIEGSLRKAAATGKPVLMEFTASWCVYCKRMEKTTFVDPAIVSSVNQQFVAVRIDADQHKDLVADLAIKGLPAILIVSPDLKILARIPGFQTPEALLTKIQNVPGVSRPATALAHRKVPAGRPAASVSQQPVAQQPVAQAPVAPQPRKELEFEPITDEPAVARNRPMQAQAVSRPAAAVAVDEGENPFAEVAARPEPADSTGRARLDDAEFSPQARVASHGQGIDINGESSDESEFFAAISDKPSTVVKPSAPSNTNVGSSNDRPMFNGTCLVTAVEERDITPGVSRHQLIYRGHLLYFSSEECKERFQARPAEYWPMMDGSCAISMLDSEQRVPGQLQFAAVFRKRLWVFTSEKNMREFLRDPADIFDELEEMNAFDPAH